MRTGRRTVVTLTKIGLRRGPVSSDAFQLRSGLPPRLYLDRGLFSRSVIAGPGVNLDGWQSLGRVQLDFDLPPLVARIRWFIPDDILVTQLHSDLGRNIGQIGQLRYPE